ncbi:Arginine kinase [Fasciola hepatica]|uniref:Arginine kinase n=1 Tax=Fasciola hepatica TaxID=6192 RepID=A0A4E0RDF6_FASHE|nr:Arginine kinase [Fasciola hepatica]
MQVEPLKSLQQKIISDERNHSLTKKYLTKSLVEKYEEVKTALGGSLAQCVNTNAHNPGALLPRACDLGAYETFKDFFDPLIKDYHKVHTPDISHPPSNFGDLSKLEFKDLNADGNMVVSTRVRLGRTVEGYGFGPTLTKEMRLELEEKAIYELSKTLKFAFNSRFGFITFCPSNLGTTLRASVHARVPLLSSLPNFKVNILSLTDVGAQYSVVILKICSVLRDAGGYIDWPHGRGIFINHAENFLVWVNEEDHIRVISMEKGGDLITIYKRLSGEICEKHGIQPRGTHGEHTASVGGVYDLSNKRRLGLTELEAVTEMYNGVKSLLDLEKQMQAYNKNAPPGVMPIEPLTYLAHLLEAASIEKCYTRKHLTADIIKKFDGVRTKNGATLAHMIRNCAYNPRAICPRTGEAECYTIFADYLDAVIRDYHCVQEDSFKHPPPTFGDLEKLPFGDLDPNGQFIVSTRVRVGRSVENYLFPTIIGTADRLSLESKISLALKSLTGEHAGTYHPLSNMSEETRNQLVLDHFLFKNDDPVLRDAGGYRDWPVGRGIFHNKNKTFLVWVCEEDHMRIISMQQGGNLAAVYRRLIEGIQMIETKLNFAHSDKFGYLTCCPSLHGEHTESPDGTYDISNKRRLGLTELTAAQEMAEGVAQIIQLEKSL